MGNRNYSGMSFETWTNQETWFWRVVNPNRNGGTIGAAATEMDALREACDSIDEMSAQRRGCATIWRGAPKTSATSGPRRFDSNIESKILATWERSLASLERYLSCAGSAPP